MFKSAANAGVTSWCNVTARGCGNIQDGLLHRACLQVSQVSGRYQDIRQVADPCNYPAITAQLAANELINATDTWCWTALARVYCDRSSFRCQVQIKLLVRQWGNALNETFPMNNGIRNLHSVKFNDSFAAS